MKLLNWIFKWLSVTRLWVWFANVFIGKLTFRILGYTHFPMEKYEEEILSALEKSDEEGRFIYAFVCKDPMSFGAWVITTVSGSNWSHTGLIYPDHRHIVHMVGKTGITEDHILTILKKNDNFAIVRFALTEVEYVEYTRRVEKYKKLKAVYDYQQELDDDGVLKLYCSELIWRCGAGLVDKEEFRPREELGRKLFEPDDVYINGEIIFEYRHESSI